MKWKTRRKSLLKFKLKETNFWSWRIDRFSSVRFSTYSRRANNEWVDHGKVDHPRERLPDTKNLTTKRFSYHKTIKITIRATFLHILNPERDPRAHYRNTSHSLFPISRKLSSKDFSNLEGTRNVRSIHAYSRVTCQHRIDPVPCTHKSKGTNRRIV